MSGPVKMKHSSPRSYPRTSSREQPPEHSQERLGSPPDGRPVSRTTPRDAALLLKTGLWFLVAGIAAIVLIETVFGGIHDHGPHSNGGWILLIVAATCVPLGIMVSVLGGAKWLGSKR